jgi:hypothetical protein
MILEQPPSEETSAAGLVARMYMRDEHRDIARRHLRRRYHDGVQLAFCYYGVGWTPIQMQRFRQFMAEED